MLKMLANQARIGMVRPENEGSGPESQ
jgi:hypothetical protein